MKVVIAADHAGFSLKEKLKSHLGNKAIDISPKFVMGDDFPLIAKLACETALKKKAKAVLCCGSGHGMCIVANKLPGVRACLARDVSDAVMARNDEDVNVLCLGGMITSASAADRIVDAFLQTPFAGHTRYKRRLKQIKNLE